MTITAAPSEQSYGTDGIATVFAIPFPFDTAADIKITSTDASGNILTLSTGFTISGGAGSTGNATFSVAPVTGLTITIYDDPARTQPTDYVSLDAFPAESHERALDRVTRIAKRLYQLVQRSVRFPDGDVSTDGVLGSVANRKGKYLFFNAVTGAIEYAANIVTTALSQSIIGQLLNPQTTAENTAGLVPTNYFYKAYDVRRYGILNDGTTDVTALCNTLGAKVWTSDIVLVFPAGPYKITDTVIFTGGNIHILMEPGAQFVYSGTADRPAVIRDYTAGGGSIRTERWSVTTAVSHPFTNFSFIGVQFKGALASSHIYLDAVFGFTEGWQFFGNATAGVAYNDIILGSCFNCARGLHLTSQASPNNGFINENNFYGGQFQVTGGFNTANPTVACYGIYFDAQATGYTGHNNNHFWKPCFQLSHTASNPAREPIRLNNCGGFNQFHGIRAEDLYGAVMHIDADTVSVNNNKLEIGYLGVGGGACTALISETDGGFSYANWCTAYPGVETRSHHHSGDLVSKAWAPASANYAVLGHFVQGSGASTESSSGLGEIGKDFLVINSGSLGTYIDTSFYKEFEVHADLLATRSGRIAVVAYDSTGTQISSTRAVYGQLGTQSATYGTASYSSSADPNVPIAFRVDSTVKSIKLFFAPGTNPVCLRGYTITAYATGYPSATSGFPNYGLSIFGGPFAPVQKINTTAPNGILGEGYTPRGDIRWNGNAVAGNTVPAGHICTAAGWNARAWVATTAYQLNMLRTNDTAPVKTYVCRQAGTSAGSGGPTGTGTSIADGGCLWDYVGVPVTTAATWTALANVP